MPAVEHASPDPRARFVWTDDHGQGRNVFALFRREFVLDDKPDSLVLCLFADSRYRLRVNGEVVGYGPARFMLVRPEYDRHELAPFLRAGVNVVTVEVNAFGASTFEAEPSAGGFIAWTAGGDIDFATPGEWRARVLRDRDTWSPPWSFAQPPVEILDLSLSDSAWHLPGATVGWASPVLLGDQTRWGPFAPRSIPPLSNDVQGPEWPVMRMVLDSSEARIGFRVDAGSNPACKAPHCRVAYATFLWSPREQRVPVSIFWGPHFLNGRALEATRRHERGNREEFELDLQAGWNLLFGAPEILQDSWGVLIGLPRSAGLMPRAEPDLNCPSAIRHTGAIKAADYAVIFDTIPRDEMDIRALPVTWREIPLGEDVALPARQMAWDRVADGNDSCERLWSWPCTLESEDGRSHALLLDAGREFIGHWILDIEAPPGTVVDVSSDEVLSSQGLIDVYRDQFLNNTADRVIWHGGRRLVEGFRPHGGRYLQLSVRLPVGAGRVVVHEAGFRRTLAVVDRVGWFECSDPVLTWAWGAGADTIEASCEDAFVDPWRERGVYIGDTLVEHLAMSVFSRDSSMTRRCLINWALSQRPDGLLLDNAPSCHDKALADYSLLWILILRNFWRLTGDRRLPAELWPCVRGILCAPAWRESGSALWDVDHLAVFIDWSAPKDAKRGESAAVNAYRVMALDAAAEMADALSLANDAAALRREADRVRSAFGLLWDEAGGRYACSRIGGNLSSAQALHGNILALIARIPSPEREARILPWVLDRLSRNHRKPKEGIELFFLFHALEMLCGRGLEDEAIALMVNHYGIMMRHGAWTLWECLAMGLTGNGSFCHGWSASPTHCLSRHVLGVSWEAAGDHDDVWVRPMSGGLTWAAGAVPHPRGLVEVSWRVQGGSLDCRVVAPPGVRVRVEPVGALASLSLSCSCETVDQPADLSLKV